MFGNDEPELGRREALLRKPGIMLRGRLTVGERKAHGGPVVIIVWARLGAEVESSTLVCLGAEQSHSGSRGRPGQASRSTRDGRSGLGPSGAPGGVRGPGRGEVGGQAGGGGHGVAEGGAGETAGARRGAGHRQRRHGQRGHWQRGGQKRGRPGQGQGRAQR